MGAKREFDIQCGDAEGKNCMKKVQSDLLSLLSHMLFHQPTSVTFTDEIKAEAHAQAVSSLMVIITELRVPKAIMLTALH